MAKLKFTDGLTVETGGPLRTLELKDGWYVVGEGRMIPAKDKASAEKLLDEMILSLFSDDDDEDGDDGGAYADEF